MINSMVLLIADWRSSTNVSQEQQLKKYCHHWRVRLNLNQKSGFLMQSTGSSQPAQPASKFPLDRGPHERT
uniref:Uncharacterized protein n=1 Tax=Salix viminalis TaxID=40686 RepID=A0A6N2KC50_SALVM